MNLREYASKHLKEKEELVEIVRRHPFTVVTAVSGGAVLLLLDFFLLAWWFRHHWWGAFGFVLLLLIGLWWVARGWYSWSLNSFIITSQRIIDIDQHGFFRQTVSEATYDKMQDVRYTISGFWPTVFKYGSIEIQTAGNSVNLKLDGVQHPVGIQQLITDLQRRAAASGGGGLSAAELVTVVERLRQKLGPDSLESLLRGDDSKD